MLPVRGNPLNVASVNLRVTIFMIFSLPEDFHAVSDVKWKIIETSYLSALICTFVSSLMQGKLGGSVEAAACLWGCMKFLQKFWG
jgi:hypothetical protein